MSEDPIYDMDEEGEAEMDDDYGPEDGLGNEPEFDYGDEEPEAAKSGDELDEYMEDIEEMDDVKGKLKIPKDVVGDGEDDESDEGLLGDEGSEDQEGFGQDEDEEDFENDVFAMARENKEMGDTTASEGPNFANAELFKTMNKIEDEMMDEKPWMMKGEVAQKDRQYNSLLDQYVDFDTATKAPPKITQETTNEIEAMIKQRILDEMFDDPVRKVEREEKNLDDDFTLDFLKNSKGLGETYADDYQKKLMNMNKDVFLDNDLAGADSALKKEIEDIFTGLMRNLNQLSNIHFTPKRLTKETTIRTQNVPALTLEEAIPIGVSSSGTKSAREVFTIAPKNMREKSELTKEEKLRERAHRKRQIRSHLQHKEKLRKEINREKGISQIGERFKVKEIQQQIDKKKKLDKKNKLLGLTTSDDNKNAFKSGKFFNAMDKIQRKDKERKDLKRTAKEKGVALESFHNNVSAKRHKL